MSTSKTTESVTAAAPAPVGPSASPSQRSMPSQNDGYRSGVKIGGVDLAELKLDSSNRKKNAAVLAAGYTPLKRRFEISVMTVFLTLEVVVLYRALGAASPGDIWLVLAMFVLGQVVTDFVSGVVHWSCDTWGQLDTPVFGPTFIRSFREHHVDPTAMCSHDFIETNSDPSIPSVVLNLYVVLWRPFDPSSRFDVALHFFCFFGGIFAAFTNEFHKWSHMHNAPWWVSALQSTWVVLPKRHHAVHHKPPFDKYYCITTGHLNWFLDTMGFWRGAEFVLSALTGAVPRQDDKLWTGQIYGKKKE